VFRAQLPRPEIRSIALDPIERETERKREREGGRERVDTFKQTARIIVMIISPTPQLSVIFLTNAEADPCNIAEYLRRNITITAAITVIIRVDRYRYSENAAGNATYKETSGSVGS